MVYSIAYHLLRDRLNAEEVAQDVFLQLSRELHAVASPAHELAWLRKVTCHRAIDRLRAAAAAGERFPLRDEVPESEAEGALGDPILARYLARRVAELPDRMRAVLVLRYTEDLGPEDIAAALELPLNTVKSLLRRALVQLRGETLPTLEEAKA